MSYVENKESYLALINRFVRCEITAPDFQQRFMTLWKTDRDEQLAARNAWPKRFDLELDDAFKKGKLSEKDYLERSASLWGLDTVEKRTFVAFLDQVFSACDCFIADPSPSIDPLSEYTETQLRDYVAAKLGVHKQVI